MGFSDLFKSRSTTVTKDPMLTKEQLQAQQMLAQLASTGSYGGINLGEAYNGSLGDFNQTGTEQLAGGNLLKLLQSGGSQSAGFNTARNTLTGLANNTFNPDDPSSGYAAYSRQVARSGKVANDAINRESAITGDRFSTSIGRQKADLGAQQSDILASKLGELYNTAQDRSLQAAQGLGNLELQGNSVDTNNIQQGFQYGDLQRELNNMQAQAKYSEFIRQREEKLKQIDIGSNLFNRNVQFGEMSTTTKAPSIFSSILGQVNPILGSYNTAKYGAANAPNQSQLSDLVKIAMSMVGGGAGAGASSGGFGGGQFSIGNNSANGAMAGFKKLFGGGL